MASANSTSAVLTVPNIVPRSSWAVAGRHDRRMGVSENQRPIAEQAIDELVAVDVADPAADAVIHIERKRLVGGGRRAGRAADPPASAFLARANQARDCSACRRRIETRSLGQGLRFSHDSPRVQRSANVANISATLPHVGPGDMFIGGVGLGQATRPPDERRRPCRLARSPASQPELKPLQENGSISNDSFSPASSADDPALRRGRPSSRRGRSCSRRGRTRPAANRHCLGRAAAQGMAGVQAMTVVALDEPHVESAAGRHSAGRHPAPQLAANRYCHSRRSSSGKNSKYPAAQATIANHPLPISPPNRIDGDRPRNGIIGKKRVRINTMEIGFEFAERGQHRAAAAIASRPNHLQVPWTARPSNLDFETAARTRCGPRKLLGRFEHHEGFGRPATGQACQCAQADAIFLARHEFQSHGSAAGRRFAASSSIAHRALASGPLASHAPRPYTRPPAKSPAQGSCRQAARSPGATTSACGVEHQRRQIGIARQLQHERRPPSERDMPCELVVWERARRGPLRRQARDRRSARGRGPIRPRSE